MILRLALVAIIIGIGYLSLTPTGGVTLGNDKISHFLAYTVLMLNIGLIWYTNRKRLMNGIIFALSYGALIEVVQHFVPGRVMSINDIYANAIGVLLGLLITVFFYKRIHRFLKSARII